MEEQFTMAPMPWLRIWRQLVLHRRPHAALVDRGEPVEVLGPLIGAAGVGNLDAGIVERHVQPAESSHGLGDGSGDLVLVSHITGQAESLVSGRGQPAGGGLDGDRVDVD
jgi:hypothetical protein